ncbi:peroxiredoxin [Nitrospirillum iridis]|uniref:Glutathione-dependent peroxiredoxin n=1 Tax=Nitrospirillum iridis TaxID=765888 RepID=A0A7X0ECV7_9PROT|nr:peroxiredoxin [Nitrospirillum iridis]MBB6249719.1 peroxiredoxin [Nitrospirillum iridis]
MTIQVGDTFPSVAVKHLTDAGMQETSTEALLKGKKVVLFAVPGAFTPTCSAKHLPGFVQNAEALKAKGVDAIICLAVNDPFVMRAWAKANDVGDTVFMLPDGNGTLTRDLGLVMDGTAYNLGQRSQRFALVIDDGVVTRVDIEKPGAFEVSSAEAVLKNL